MYCAISMVHAAGAGSFPLRCHCISLPVSQAKKVESSPYLTPVTVLTRLEDGSEDKLVSIDHGAVREEVDILLRFCVVPSFPVSLNDEVNIIAFPVSIY